MYGIFTLISSFEENQNYYLRASLSESNHDSKEVVKAYSDKSFLRESRSLNAILEECNKNNKTLIWIAPFHTEIFNAISQELLSRLLWISPANFCEPSKFIISDKAALDYFLRDIGRADSFSIQSHFSIKKLNFSESMEKTITGLIKKSAVRIKTIEHFSASWKRNFKHNFRYWINLSDVSQIKDQPPEFFALGGPSVDLNIQRLKKAHTIWCADTALPTLLFHKIFPTTVFSIDAGYASYEHFISTIDGYDLSGINLALDPLSFPALFKLKFKKIYTYANSNPLIQKTTNIFSLLENTSDDVYGLMLSVYHLLYGRQMTTKLPEMIGLDGAAIRRVTHLRGSAYHRRQYMRNQRLYSPELYFYYLSSRYNG